jgi:hypothetical protein
MKAELRGSRTFHKRLVAEIRKRRAIVVETVPAIARTGPVKTPG